MLLEIGAHGAGLIAPHLPPSSPSPSTHLPAHQLSLHAAVLPLQRHLFENQLDGEIWLSMNETKLSRE
jgi:hypothetical protein